VQVPVVSKKKYPSESENKAKEKGILFQKESQNCRTFQSERTAEATGKQAQRKRGTPSRREAARKRQQTSLQTEKHQGQVQCRREASAPGRASRTHTHTRAYEPASRLKSPINRQRPGANTNLQAYRPERPINDFSATTGYLRVNARGRKLPSLRTSWKNVRLDFFFHFSSYRTGEGGKAANELARLASELAG